MPNDHFSNGKKIAFTATMFLYLFLVIASFWIFKPLKKKLFIEYYKADGGFTLGSWEMLGSQAEQLAKIMNMAIALGAVIAITLLVRRFRRQRLTYCCMGFLLVMLGWFSVALREVSEWEVWAFYWFGDLYVGLMLAAFFSFLHDSVDVRNAKRFYGIIVLGAVTGGAFGSTFFRGWIKHLETSQWLLIALGAGVAVIALAFLSGLVAQSTSTPESHAAAASSALAKAKVNAAQEGGRLVFQSRYLLAIAGIVFLYEITSTVIDFQFTATIEHLLSGDEIGEQFATIYAISNIAALVVQLSYGLLTMALPGIQIRWVLMVLPCTILLGSVVFIVFPILWVGSLLNTADSAFAYSVNQTARETLYVPISRNEKYKARAFIEMFLQRTAKVVAIGVTLAITFLFTTKGADGGLVLNFDGLRWLSLFTCAVIAVWFYCVGIVSRKFEALRRDQTEPDDTALGQAQEQPSAGAA